MGFVETRIPLKIHPGSGGSLKLADERVILRSGWDHVNRYWEQELRTWDLRRQILTEAQYLELLSFFLAVANGRSNGFRARDLSDYRVPDAYNSERSLCQAISDTQFQLVKRYASDGQTWTRTIKKPVAGTVQLYVDEVFQPDGYTVDYSSGIITFDAAPGTTPTAQFEFDVPVKFETNELPHSWEGFQLLNAPVVLREIRL